MSHPSDESLALLAELGPSAPGAEQLRAHLAGCAECVATIAELKRALAPGHAPVAAGDELSAGVRLGRFVVERAIGAGSSSIVYSAHDPALDRTVALKVLHPVLAPALAARVLDEARALAKVRHPHVSAVYDVGVSGPLQWIAMEYLDGVSLRVHLKTHAPDWNATFALFSSIASGLAAAHAASVVQRDLKPENVMVTREGRVVITDFGLASTSVDVHDGRGMLIGTPRYMAPEQLEGGVATPSSDQFAFCVCLAEALFGAPPFAADSVNSLLARMRQGPTFAPPVVPPRTARDLDTLRAVLTRGLAVDAQRRYPSMSALWADLAPLAGPRHRRTGAIVASAVVVAALTTVLLARAGEAPPCRAAPRLAPVWSDERRLQLLERFDDSDFAREQGVRVAQHLDEYTRRWAATYEDVCAGTAIRRDQSAELLDARMSCLDRRLAGVAALLQVLERLDPTVVMHAARASSSLDDAASCRHETVESVAPLSPTEQADLSRVEALVLTGRYADAAEAASHPRAEASGAAKAEALRLEGRALMKLGRLTDAAQALTSAAAAALTHRTPRTFVQAMTTLGLVQATGLEQPLEAARTLALARGASGALGAPGDLESELANSAAFVEVANGRFDAALELLGQALAAREAMARPDDPFVPGIKTNIAMVLELSGQLERAARAHDEAVRAWQTLVGARHPDTALARFNRGVLSMNSARDAEALADFDEAARVRHETLGPAHVLVANTEAARALTLVRLGQQDAAAAALERAMVSLGTFSASQRASLLNTFGQVALVRGDDRGAAASFEQARQLRDPNSVSLSYDLVGLARVALSHDDCVTAQPLLSRAAALRATAQPPLKAEVIALASRCEEGPQREASLERARALFANHPTARRLVLDTMPP